MWFDCHSGDPGDGVAMPLPGPRGKLTGAKSVALRGLPGIGDRFAPARLPNDLDPLTGLAEASRGHVLQIRQDPREAAPEAVGELLVHLSG
jgi:hypothetical protein